MQVGLSDNVDLAWLQGHLLNEAAALHVLVQAGMRPRDAREILQLRVLDTSASANVRVDLRGDATFWINDLETDEMYRCAGLPESCSDSSMRLCRCTCDNVILSRTKWEG